MWEPLKEIWHSRELLFELAHRDVRIRYKQTLLGAAWAVFTPVLMMLLFTQIFARVAKIDTGGIPYPIFVYCGLLPWQFFAACLKGSVESLTRNSRLVTKIYLPREVFPLSIVLSSLVDFAVAGVVLAGLMAWYGFAPPTAVLFALPVIFGVQVVFTIGMCLLLSMGNLFYRDVKYIFEVGLLVWMFATSVVYPMPTSGGWAFVLALNPMTHIIDAYRHVLLLGQLPDPLGLTYATLVAGMIAAYALRWFHEAEYLFAEMV